MRIVRLGPGDASVLGNAQRCFGHPLQEHSTQRFLASENHHLLVAIDGEQAVGFVSGVEMTHPDKGTEMFLYELSVDPHYRRQGCGAALVRALADLARGRGCYGMWVLTDDDNVAALATYRSAGATREQSQVVCAWTFDET